MALRDQLTLSLFDDTSLLGLTADVPAVAARSIFSPPIPGEPPELLPVDYRLAGERRLAATWRERAADNLAAIELLRRIEVEDRPATADEQQILARFVPSRSPDEAGEGEGTCSSQGRCRSPAGIAQR